MSGRACWSAHLPSVRLCLVLSISCSEIAMTTMNYIGCHCTGYYGTSRTDTFKENSNPGSDYLAEVCQAWEAEAEKAKTGRVVILRVGKSLLLPPGCQPRLPAFSKPDDPHPDQNCVAGIVLAKEGGAIGKMLPVFSLFAGGPLGSGEQWCSWIHRSDPALSQSMRRAPLRRSSEPAIGACRDDLVRMYVETATNPNYIGTYNATAPAPVRMSELCNSLGSTLGRPSWLPVPDFAVQVPSRSSLAFSTCAAPDSNF